MCKKSEELLLFLFTASVYCFICFYLPRAYPELPKNLSRSVEAVIPGGVSARQAAEIIAGAGAVDDAGALARAMAGIGIDRRIKPGLYSLYKSTPAGVARQLAKAKPVVNRVTLIPGFRYRRAAALFGVSPEGASYFNAAMEKAENFPPAVRPWLPPKKEERLVFLLPETYFLAPGPQAADEFVKRASALWYERIGRDIPAGADARSVLTRGTLASLVEGEAKAADERPVLAGIFLKRLEKNMRLQSCATVIYAWDELNIKKERLSYRDLEINSPYNTYLVGGLPPGPICVPGESSWKSALSPKKSDYLFFFAGNDGRHVFSKNYEEHLAKQRKAGL